MSKYDSTQSSNPLRVRVTCTVCARTVWANTRTGRLYSHNLPDSAEVCSASTTLVVAPVDHDAAPAVAPERVRPLAPVDYVRPVQTNDFAPVRACGRLPPAYRGTGSGAEWSMKRRSRLVG